MVMFFHVQAEFCCYMTSESLMLRSNYYIDISNVPHNNFFFAYAKNSSSGDIKRGETVQAITISGYQLCKFGLEVLAQEAD